MINYIKEFDLTREVVFALQGLPGKIIRPDHNGRFIISHDHLACIDPTQRILLEKLTGLGWLVNKIKSFLSSVNKEKNQGKVSLGLAAALKEELFEYYKMVTMIDSSGTNGPVPVTLHQIHVWSLDYYFKFITLAMLVDACQGRHGGQIACIVYRFKQQGDKQIQEMISRVSTHVMAPIRQMLNEWIFHGEIQDQHQEFFICQQYKQTMSAITDTMHEFGLNHSRSEYQLHSILYKQQHQPLHSQTPLHHNHHKQSLNSLNGNFELEYVINPKMMPGFITKQQANKILATGKAVHLLRKVCADSGSSLPIYEHLEKAFESTICVEDISFENLLERAHKEFSQKALELLSENFKLKKHLKAMRQYLLLGQGDFIRHLIDLLEPELEKPKHECRFNNIFSIFGCAIRATNAQYEDADIINRLDCRLVDVQTKNACGWDIFSLVYKVDEPLCSIFTEEKMRDYTEIFKQLWRAKRIEHLLATLWSSQMFYTKKAKAYPIVSQLFHKANILLAKMVHFMQHFQDFVMFQVVEYSWTELEAAMENAQDVDDMIAAHNSYLKKIKLGSLCQKDNKSESLNAQVNGLFQCVLELKDLLNSLWSEIDTGADKKLIVKENLLNKLSAELNSKKDLMSTITNYWTQNSQIKIQYL